MFHPIRRKDSAVSRYTRGIRLTLLLAVCLLTTTSMFAADSLTGNWQGKINVDSQELRLVLHVVKAPNAGYTATLDSPDQQTTGLAIDTITLDKDVVVFEMKLIQATFKGKLNVSKNAIVGTWSQLGKTWPVTFNQLRNVPASKSSVNSKSTKQ